MEISNRTLEKIRDESKHISNLAMTIKVSIIRDNEDDFPGEYEGSMVILSDRISGLFRTLDALYAQIEIKEEHIA